MQEALAKVNNIFCGLNEIQPGVNVSGLEVEAQRIIEIKKDLAELVSVLTPDPPQMEKVVESCKMDALSSYQAMQDLFDNLPSPDLVSDEQLRIVSLSAELFVKRCQDYLSSKRSLQTYFNGV